MPFVRRNSSGTIIALSTEPAEGFEPIEHDAPEAVDFAQQLSSGRSPLAESDLEVIRVLDDLVNVLIEKNLIRFTDLPSAAQRKLLERRGMRENGSDLSLLEDDSSVI